MKRDCLRVEEAIWEAGRNGDVAPVHVRPHLEGCRECARAATEARRITQLMRDGDRVPEAPDCTSGVTALIFNARKRQVWSYAWAGAAAVVVIFAFLTMFRPVTDHPKPSVIVKKPIVSEVSGSKHTAKKGTDTFSLRAIAGLEGGNAKKRQSPFSLARANPVATVSTRLMRRHYRRQSAPEAVAVNKPDTVSARLAAAPIDPNRPVAVAVVTWEQPTESESNSYEYTKTDADGRVTTCKVEDTGDVVKISMSGGI